MRKVERSEILDFETYEDNRDARRKDVMVAKALRRIHVGDYLTFLFENWLTMGYQIQEMIRAERIVREADILHEIKTYNALLGEPGELAATLLIEISDPAERPAKLREWLKLPQHIHVVLDDGKRRRCSYDPTQLDSERLSAVQYLRFDVGAQVPRAIVVDLPGLECQSELTPDQRAALAEDLAG